MVLQVIVTTAHVWNWQRSGAIRQLLGRRHLLVKLFQLQHTSDTEAGTAANLGTSAESYKPLSRAVCLSLGIFKGPKRNSKSTQGPAFMFSVISEKI